MRHMVVAGYVAAFHAQWPMPMLGLYPTRVYDEAFASHVRTWATCKRSGCGAAGRAAFVEGV